MKRKRAIQYLNCLFYLYDLFFKIRSAVDHLV